MTANGARPRRVLFVQGADPAFYPPILQAASAMADSGWQVTILSTPQARAGLEASSHPAVREIRLRARPSYRLTGHDYLAYCLAAIVNALLLRPDVVYASDPLGAGPGLLAATIIGARLVYHEHDSPSEKSSGRAIIRWTRRLAAKKAILVIFPNAERAWIAQVRLGFEPKALRVVWNLPSRHHLPAQSSKTEAPIAVYYHGSITPERLPPSVPEAISRFGGMVVLRIAGYEAPTGKGYIADLQNRWGRAEAGGMIDWLGAVPTKIELLRQAARSHIGLAMMPMSSNDINMLHMAGASNKAFDYMAAEMALVVSDLPEWRAMFVEPGHAVACDPRSVNSVEAALRQLIDKPKERERMIRKSREKIERVWHYEVAFASIIADIEYEITAPQVNDLSKHPKSNDQH